MKTAATMIRMMPAQRLALTPPVLSLCSSPKMPVSSRITPYAPSRPPMMLRMSSAPAVCFLVVAVSSAISRSSSERHVQGDHHDQRYAGQGQRPPVPGVLRLVGVDQVLLGRLAPDEPL